MKRHDLVYWLLVICCIVLLIYYGICIYFQIYRPSKTLVILGVENDSGTSDTETPPPQSEGKEVERAAESGEIQAETTG